MLNLTDHKWRPSFTPYIDEEKMYNSNNSEPAIPPTISDPNLKEYRCPHCDKFLFKGNIKRLRMVCHHCQIMINTNESHLVRQRKIEFTN